jgi:hypothetical protein
MTTTRKSIPDSTIADLLVSTRRRCCLCYFLANDKSQKRVQIAHIDRKRDNNAPANLVPLCLDHHDEYDSRTSQSKGITEEELRRYKNMLVDTISREHVDKSSEISVEERELPRLGSALFYGYGTLFAHVSRIIFTHDPVQINFGGNHDEYDAEAHDIIGCLQDNDVCLPTAQICKLVFERWFNPRIVKEFGGFEEMAKDIDAAWEHFKERNYVYGAIAS